MTESLSLQTVEKWYRKYASDLKKVREEQALFYRESGYLPSRQVAFKDKALSFVFRAKSYLSRGALLKPQLDDLEAEITYLRIRETRPDTVVEISPCGGWSSMWILSALRDNGKGQLHSYDLVDIATRNVPKSLAQNRWHFHQGDATKDLSSLPKKIDYLFIDSDHSAKFAEWYIATLFPLLAPNTPVSVHDVFHTADPAGFDSEGGVVVSWLENRKIPFFTASGAKEAAQYQAIQGFKRDLGIGSRIHHSDYNSMMFFNLP